MVAADEPGDAVELVRLEVGREPEVGGGEAGVVALSIGGEEDMGRGEEAELVGGRHKQRS